MLLSQALAVWLIFARMVVCVPPLVGMPSDMCLHVEDRETCNSDVCPGYAWCELCHKCLYAERAVTAQRPKDEL